ncbi:MAG TPA: transposase [Haliangiales bacterium]|nr:transposase [Haliangiales bacterium]
MSLAARGGRGGWRARAGRPAKAPDQRKGHRPRPSLASRHPVHVTLRVLPSAPHLRRRHCFDVLRAAFARGKDRFGFRLTQFTVQGNHMHLVCEAKDKRALTRGMQGLAIRIARRLNRRVGRTGRLFAERYHARILRSPTEVRHALAYVLNNSRHHPPRDVTFARDWIDDRSSAPWFDGWKWPPCLRRTVDDECPVVAPSTWLLRTGWRLRGLIAPDEVPGPPRWPT